MNKPDWILLGCVLLQAALLCIDLLLRSFGAAVFVFINLILCLVLFITTMKRDTA